MTLLPVGVTNPSSGSCCSMLFLIMNFPHPAGAFWYSFIGVFFRETECLCQNYGAQACSSGTKGNIIVSKCN